MFSGDYRPDDFTRAFKLYYRRQARWLWWLAPFAVLGLAYAGFLLLAGPDGGAAPGAGELLLAAVGLGGCGVPLLVYANRYRRLQTASAANFDRALGQPGRGIQIGLEQEGIRYVGPQTDVMFIWPEVLDAQSDDHVLVLTIDSGFPIILPWRWVPAEQVAMIKAQRLGNESPSGNWPAQASSAPATPPPSLSSPSFEVRVDTVTLGDFRAMAWTDTQPIVTWFFISLVMAVMAWLFAFGSVLPGELTTGSDLLVALLILSASVTLTVWVGLRLILIVDRLYRQPARRFALTRAGRRRLERVDIGPEGLLQRFSSGWQFIRWHDIDALRDQRDYLALMAGGEVLFLLARRWLAPGQAETVHALWKNRTTT